MNKRRIIRTQRLLAELGHEDVIEALKHAQQMSNALRIIRTWASIDGCLDRANVLSLCDQAIAGDKPCSQ